MAYVRKTSIARDFRIERYYHTGRYHEKGERRGKKVNPSPQSVKEANEKRATEELMLKLNANFTVADYWVTLTYEKENKTRNLDEMKEDIRKFLRDVKREYKKQGEELKFVYVLRVGKRGARHFHLVMNKIDSKAISKHWKFGFCKIMMVYSRDDSGTFDYIADYMMKESEITRTVFEKENLKRYSCSRNLEKPIVEKVVIKRASTFRQKPKVPKGWKLIADSEKSGVNLYGHIYYEFKCIRI